VKIIYNEKDIRKAIELSIENKGLSIYGVVCLDVNDDGDIVAKAFIKDEEK
jgi:hypothetical protein